MNGKQSEAFSQQRMDRCVEVQGKIMRKWHETRSLEYRVVSDKNLNGLTFEELQKCNLSIGVGDDLTSLPLIDGIVLTSMLTMQQYKLSGQIPASEEPGAEDMILVKTRFTHFEILEALEEIRIEMPSE